MEKMMVIDPDIHELQKLNSDLSKDFAVLTCSRGDKVLNLFQVFQPSALVLDPSTPGLNARDFIQQIRSIPEKGLIPIITLTKFTSIKHIEENLSSEVDLIYSKPCSNDRIHKKLSELLSKPRSPVKLEPVEV